MRSVLTIMVLLFLASCRSVESEMATSVSMYGNRAHVTLHNDRVITGELLLQQRNDLWIVSLQNRVITIPLRDMYSVEVLDTEVSEYFVPTVLVVGAPWVVLGLVGASYTGDVEYLPAGILVGGLLTLLPVAFNEAGMTNPDFTANDIALGELAPYLRYPFHTVSDTLRIRILHMYGQETPDTLRIPTTQAATAGE